VTPSLHQTGQTRHGAIAHVAKAAQGIAQIAGNGAHVTAFAAGHFKFDVICIRAICQQQFFDPKRRAAISNFSPSLARFTPVHHRF
jgi:hypothetical protein